MRLAPSQKRKVKSDALVLSMLNGIQSVVAPLLNQNYHVYLMHALLTIADALAASMTKHIEHMAVCHLASFARHRVKIIILQAPAAHTFFSF